MCAAGAGTYDFDIAIDRRPRGGTVGILLVVCLCGVLVGGAFGIYDLQVRLERWDRDRHAED